MKRINGIWHRNGVAYISRTAAFMAAGVK